MTDSKNSLKRIAIIPGDGIGKEVIPEAVKVMKAAAAATANSSSSPISTGAPIAISATVSRFRPTPSTCSAAILTRF